MSSTPQIPALGMRAGHFWYSMIAIFLMTVCPYTLAQNGHAHTSAAPQSELSSSQRSRQSALLKIVRDSTERFKDVAEAEREKYSLIFGCVSGPDEGAMGLHYLNGDLLDEANQTGVLDPTRPQIVLYEPTSNGGLRLTGADFVVFADAWNTKHPQDPPQLMGQLFHLFDSPNRFGLPAFYTLHVWAWKDNPAGAFVNWHPNVSCQSFAGQSQ
ncbi:MAG: hypothetical protein ACRD20_11815 [Terriglobales bacterium]